MAAPAPAKSYRELVFDALRGHGAFLTVEEISKKTGLDKKQIRGVLYAPSLKGSFTIAKESDGTYSYQFADSEVERAGGR